MWKPLRIAGCCCFLNLRTAAVCTGFAACELALSSLSERAFWGNAGLPWQSKCTLAVLTILVWCCIGWCWNWSIGLRQFLERRARWPWLSASLVAFVCFACVSAYAVSIAMFWRTGAFASADVVPFVLINLRMLSLYCFQAEKALSGAVALVVLFTTTIVVRAHGRAAMGCEVRRHASVWLGLPVFVVAFDLAFVLLLLNDHEEQGPAGAWWQSTPSAAYEVSSRTSPVLSALTTALTPRDQNVKGDLTEEQLGLPRGAPVATTDGAARGTQRSVLLIAVESLRHDVVGAVHQGLEIMPHLNRLAREGRWFRHAYAQSTHSDYADPCLISGLYPLRSARHHYYSNADPWPKAMLYDVLKAAGYRTAIFSSQNEAWGNMDAFLGSPHLDEFFDSRLNAAPTHSSEKDSGFSRFVSGARVAGKLDDAVTVAHLGDWIHRQAASKLPFCVYLNLQSSHFPYQIPTGDQPFQPAALNFDASFARYPPEKVEVVRNAYFNALHYIDIQLGTVLRNLDELGIRDQVLIVVAGDNGEAFYENGHPTHAGPPFEPAIRVACIMHCPGLLSPAVDEGLIQAIDIAPTILGVLQLPIPACHQGVDVLDANNSPPHKRIAFIHCESALSSAEAVVTAAGWKYVRDRRLEISRLHNLKADPSEKENVLAREPVVGAILSRLVDRWRRQQLLYYGLQQYHGFYFPPRTPVVSEQDLKILEKAANTGAN